MKFQGTQDSQNYLKKKKKVVGLILLDIKTYHKATVNQIV